MSLTVSLFMDLSPSNPSPPHPIQPPATPSINPSLNRLTQTLWAEPVAQTQITSNFLQKAFISQGASLPACISQRAFLLCSQASLAWGSAYLTCCSQGLADVSRSHCNLTTGFEGCESSVTSCWAFLLSFAKEKFPYQENIYSPASREFSAARHCFRPQWLWRLVCPTNSQSRGKHFRVTRLDPLLTVWLGQCIESLTYLKTVDIIPTLRDNRINNNIY